ncbi:MAG: hypothetical protein M1814_006373 [Vezdaea aestivalis]|nr:MAG: hypothetical protein M1814_006373 [Vezdaea aestivalis]
MMISGAIENAIYCEGELPPWIDRISHKYNTNLELCAANFLGGHPSANLGGLCRDPFRGGLAFGRQFAHPDLSRDVVGGPDNVRKSNFFSATLWCLAHCACNYQPNEGYERWPISVKRDGLGQININANGEVSLLRGTGVNVVVTVFVYRTSSSKDSPPRPKKRCVPSVLESSASDEWCFLPVPPDIDLSEFDLPAMAPEPVLQSCGSSCQSNFECGGGRDTDCKCVAKPPGLIDGANRRGGFSVSNLFAACAKVQFAGSGLLAGGSGLRKRNDLELEAPWCACNSTYVSEQCCGSQEGLVWERHELKRGELGTST